MLSVTSLIMAILGYMKKDLTKHLAFLLKRGISEGFQEK
ncbi:hypothetical protein BN193_09140 [Lactococcus raffinolactis 4877]|nr:hypothetical protein BN193_09140 [Lactococcus raffinolactis 4877]